MSNVSLATLPNLSSNAGKVSKGIIPLLEPLLPVWALVEIAIEALPLLAARGSWFSRLVLSLLERHIFVKSRQLATKV